MIPAKELACMQETVSNSLPDVATVLRNPNLATGPGPDGTVATATLTAVYVNIPAHLAEPRGGYAETLAAALVDQTVWEVIFPATFNGSAVVIQREDRIQVLGLTLTVQHILGPESNTLDNNCLASAPR